MDLRQTHNALWLIKRYGHRSPAQFRPNQMDTIPLAAQSQSGVRGFGAGIQPRRA